ncbi:hypothetical protein CDL15_Pgr008735 [Punica granatum]|uniref:UDENN domain-containing protein n=1 Tax=Punica granatum TaxID=22663 RepID=A0A218VY61_PUNGR|nr:hypothetical protein CDL15_Pgr008735 [Punica granatum]
MARIFEYFVMCGIGPEIRTLYEEKGFHGTGIMYLPSLLDQYPPSDHKLYSSPPPQLPTCVLPAGVAFYSSGFDSNDPSTFPRSYPIVLTGVVSNVPLPTPGKDRVLFAIENSLLSVEAPPKDGLPHVDISFQPIIQCLDVDNLIKLFTAVLLERRILLRSNKYSLLTLVSEAICHLIYPFRWQHVYIPLLFFSGVDYIDAPTPYMMGLHSGVDTSTLAMDGVVVVELEYNRITTSEEIPPIPEPELSSLREEITKLLHPNVVGIDLMKADLGGSYELYSKAGKKPWGEDHDLQLRWVVVVELEYNRITTSEEIPPIPEPELSSLREEITKLLHPNVVGIDLMKADLGGSYELYSKAGKKPWGEDHDLQLRMIFLKFFASLLGGYRNFIENSATQVFNNQAFLKKRSRSTNEPPGPMITQFLESLGFLDYLERGLGSDENGANLLDKLQDAIGRGQNPTSILPSSLAEPEIITISDSDGGTSGSGAKYTYDRFPSNIRTEEQEERRKQILEAASRSFDYSAKHGPGSPVVLVAKDSKAETLSPMERAAERERMVLDIKVKLQGWQGQLTDEQFIAVKELLKTAIGRATSRNDVLTIRDALEVSAEMFKKDANNVPDYIQRHLISLSIWEELSAVNYAIQVSTQLIVVASHMAGLGLPDMDAWYMIETIAEKQQVGYKQFIRLRGFLSHVQQVRVGYWGISSVKAQSLSSQGLHSPRTKDSIDEGQQPAEASGVGRSWVQSMFSRDTSSRTHSFSRVRGWTSDGGASVAENGTPRKQDPTSAAQKKVQTSIRVLRGHSGAVTALHCVTRREVWDLVGDREDAGFFISGSTDCLVKIWDPSLRGNEMRATLKGHSGTVRAISSDRGKIVSGADDNSVIVWDKQTYELLEELKGHDAQVGCVRMLSGERVLTAAHDGTVKMWDVRTDTCVATVGRCASAVLCMEYDDSTGILAAAGRDAVANIWDIRAGKQMHKLLGHTKWIRSIRMVGDTLITGSDDWTARVWSVSRGACDAVLACHAGPILCVEYSASDKAIITGSSDGLIRFWGNEEGGIRCMKNVTIHSSAILSINAGEHWLGIGAADNSLSLFHRPQERMGFSSSGSKMPGWQLYRTPQKTVAVVRCVASDLERKRICSGGRNGLLRLWDATINI